MPRSRSLPSSREQSVRTLSVDYFLVDGTWFSRVLKQLAYLTRRRRGELRLHLEKHPSMNLLGRIHRETGRLDRLPFTVFLDGDSVPEPTGQALLTLSAPLSREALEEVKAQMWRMEQESLVGCGWTLLTTEGPKFARQVRCVKA